MCMHTPQIQLYMCTHVYAHTSNTIIYVYTCVCTHLKYNINICVHMCMHTPQIQLYMCTHVYAHTSNTIIYVYTCVCTHLKYNYICVHMCMHTPQIQYKYCFQISDGVYNLELPFYPSESSYKCSQGKKNLVLLIN